MNILTSNNYSYKYLNLFIILTPFAIILGTAIANFFLLLSIFTFILIDSKNYMYFYILDNFSKILALFFIYILITSLFSENNFYSSKKAFFYLKFFFFFIALKICTEKAINFFDILFKLFLPIFLIVLLDGLFQVIFSFNSIGIHLTTSRVSGFFGDEWILGAFIFHLMPFAIVGILFYKNISSKTKNIYLLFLIPLCTLIIYMSGERTIFFISLIYIPLTTLFIFFLKKKKLYNIYFNTHYCFYCNKPNR